VELNLRSRKKNLNMIPRPMKAKPSQRKNLTRSLRNLKNMHIRMVSDLTGLDWMRLLKRKLGCGLIKPRLNSTLGALTSLETMGLTKTVLASTKTGHGMTSIVQ
jgi:hypothetical protein